jgi:hypothetical protein
MDGSDHDPNLPLPNETHVRTNVLVGCLLEQAKVKVMVMARCLPAVKSKYLRGVIPFGQKAKVMHV